MGENRNLMCDTTCTEGNAKNLGHLRMSVSIYEDYKLSSERHNIIRLVLQSIFTAIIISGSGSPRVSLTIRQKVPFAPTNRLYLRRAHDKNIVICCGGASIESTPRSST